MQQLISIIVPVYKVEPYLRRCVDSILAQTYTNIEVILVDDGSPDGCPAICDEYAAKDSRIVVIHQQNAGVSAARNAGLDAAKGEYIGFVDSDDWIEPDMYETMLKLIVDNQADMACMTYSVEDHYITDTVPIKKGTEEFTGMNALKDLCTNGKINVSVYTKLISAKILYNIRFTVGLPIGEDKLFCMQVLGACRCVVYEDWPCYHYFQREGSAIHTNSGAWALDRIQNENQYYGYLSSVFADELEYADVVCLVCALCYAYDLWNEKLLTKGNYDTLIRHITPHKTSHAVKLLSRKWRISLSILMLGRTAYIAAREACKLLCAVKEKY